MQAESRADPSPFNIGPVAECLLTACRDANVERYQPAAHAMPEAQAVRRIAEHATPHADWLSRRLKKLFGTPKAL